MTLGRVARTFVTCWAALGIIGLTFLPPEHVHATHTDDGHHSNLVHRHYAPHRSVAGNASGVSDDDDDDDQPQWIEARFTGAKPAAQVHRVDRALIQDLPFASLVLAPQPVVVFTRPSVHDPPLIATFGLRAPPASSLS